MKKILLFGSTMIATFMVMTSSAGAQVLTCQCIDGIKCFLPTFYCDPFITCEGTFDVSPPFPFGSEPINSTATAIDVTATTFDPAFGTISISLDKTRPSPPTILRSNNPAERFPLTVAINFYATATIQAAPGQVYQSVRPLEYVTTNATSLPPFGGEVLTLQQNVDFVDQAGVVVFTLAGGDSRITL